ncbi:MAG: hypothetical protein M1816_002628 [Peltula sp. TS41687]|nr:MAG: hypothetical protein M1816_002628 [Peltula sp. TS41687]
MVIDSSGFAIAAILSQLYVVEQATGLAEATDAIGRDGESSSTRIEKVVVWQPHLFDSVTQAGKHTEGGDKATSRWHSVAFWSRQMTPAEQNYGTGEQELLAIVVTNHPQTHATVTTEQMNIVTPRGTMLRGGIVRTRTQPLTMRGRSRNHGVGDRSREVGIGNRSQEVGVGATTARDKEGSGYASSNGGCQGNADTRLTNS